MTTWMDLKTCQVKDACHNGPYMTGFHRMKCPAQATLERQEVDWRRSGVGGWGGKTEVGGNGSGVWNFHGDANVLQLVW